MFKLSLLPLLLLLSPGSQAKEDAVFARQENGIIHLRSDGLRPAQFVIDHGHDVNGFTTYHVLNASGNTSAFSIAHSETRAMLNANQVRSIIFAVLRKEVLTMSRVTDRSPWRPLSIPIEFNTTTYPHSTPLTRAVCCKAESDGSCSRYLHLVI